MNCIIFIFKFIALLSINELTEDTWNEIQNKTWSAMEIGPMGADLVFLHDKIGKKAVIENHGSGCCRIFSKIFEVQVAGDTVILFPINETNGLFLIEKEKYTRLVLYRQSKILYDIDKNYPFTFRIDSSILHKGCCTKLDIKQLESDTITYLNFDYPVEWKKQYKRVKK